MRFRCALAAKGSRSFGQSTVEYAVIAATGIFMIVALGALSNAIGDGLFVSHAVSAASHNVQGFLGSVADVFCY